MVDANVRWLLKAGKYSCVSSSMVDRCLLLKGGCCKKESTELCVSGSMVGGCYCKVVAVGRYVKL